jgi:hypothetical protein
VDQLDAAPGFAAHPLVDPLDLILAVDADLPAAPDEKQRQFFGKGFEAAMGRGYAARPQDQKRGGVIGHECAWTEEEPLSSSIGFKGTLQFKLLDRAHVTFHGTAVALGSPLPAYCTVLKRERS